MKPLSEQDAEGWWANRQVGVDTVLGHGRSEEEALQDLEYQIARFSDFLRRSQRVVPESLRD